jgi:glutamate-ammonia-ligase adenylyltransferase
LSDTTRLQQLRSSRALKTLPQLSRVRLDQFMPLFIEAAGQHPQADLAFSRCLPLIESVLRRTAYLVLLLENPSALQRSNSASVPRVRGLPKN